eukprot:11222824-Lingulodinium_polyedra.AAC.1
MEWHDATWHGLDTGTIMEIMSDGIQYGTRVVMHARARAMVQERMGESITGRLDERTRECLNGRIESMK